MQRSNYKRLPLAAALASVWALSAPAMAGPVQPRDIEGAPLGPDAAANAHDVNQRVRTIVRFEEAPLALYRGERSTLAAVPRAKSANGRVRLDAHSSQARAYVAYLVQRQDAHLAAMSALLGRNVPTLARWQHALNGVVVELDAKEAARVRDLPGVAALERDGRYAPATDIGPSYIGATSLWWGANAVADTVFAANFDTAGFRGEGLVAGIIDTGYNSLSPSFAVTDDTGYTVQNPLGTGHFLGQCNVANISRAGCNDKVIGVYDLVDTGQGEPATSVEDTQGHGSHTGSTVAGDPRPATLLGYTARISGMAPHANLVVYYVCSPDPAVLCGYAATVSAVDHSIQDGVVDALNYSVGGGADPWGESASLAFLAAADAGIFVAAAAGNTGTSVPVPVPGSANHLEPWVTTVAAGTHSGGPITFLLNVAGAGAPSPIGLTPAVSGSQLTGPLPSTPIKVSPDYATGTDGCNAFPAGTFAGSIALLKWSTNPPCGTNTRAANAKAAGAVAAILGSTDSQFFSSGANQTIYVFTTTGTQADMLAAYANAHPGTTASVSYPATNRAPVVGDSLANFSLLGPSWMDVVKPDVMAPGVAILAAVANDGTASGPSHVELYGGTSMATPHTTGAGLLLAGLHPDWSPMEIKSALMMTSKEAGLTKVDGVTPSTYFDRGAGRIQVDLANRAGIVLDETAAHFQAANPAATPAGNPTTLNLASLQNRRCFSAGGTQCSFQRSLRGAAGHAVHWTTSFTGVSGTATPASFTLNQNALQPLSVTIDASAYTADGNFHFGEMLLTPDDGSPVLHFPVAVGVPAPAIAVPAALSINIPTGSHTASTPLGVANNGGPTLNVTNTNLVDAGPYAYLVLNQATDTSYGYYAGYYTNAGTGAYNADDFVVAGNGVNLSRIVAPGFVGAPGAPLNTLTGHLVHFRIYHDQANHPDGAPEAGTTPNNAPAWAFDAVIGTTPGLSVAGGTITLDLAAAGSNTNLAAGRYWFLVYPEQNVTTDGQWAWNVSKQGSGNPINYFAPYYGPTTAWGADNGHPGMALRIEQRIACGAPWLSATPGTLSLGGLQNGPVTVSADSALFGSGSSAIGYLCLQSNDANAPLTAVRVTATQQ